MDKLNITLHECLQLRWLIAYCISKTADIRSKEMVYSPFGTYGTASGVLGYRLLYKTSRYYGETSRRPLRC